MRNCAPRSLNKKLTISGGEPLLQYQAVHELVRGLADFDIALYTGFELEQRAKGNNEALEIHKGGEIHSRRTVDDHALRRLFQPELH